MCEYCLKPADKKCGQCKKVSYCTPEHKKKDWKLHKLTCKSYNPQDSIVNQTQQSISVIEESKSMDMGHLKQQDDTFSLLDESAISEFR